MGLPHPALRTSPLGGRGPKITKDHTTIMKNSRTGVLKLPGPASMCSRSPRTRSRRSATASGGTPKKPILVLPRLFNQRHTTSTSFSPSAAGSMGRARKERSTVQRELGDRPVRRTVWSARAFVLGGLALAIVYTAITLALDKSAEHIGPFWVAAIAWDRHRKPRGHPVAGFRHHDWSSCNLATRSAATASFSRGPPVFSRGPPVGVECRIVAAKTMARNGLSNM